MATITIDEEKCTGCGNCVDTCPSGLFEMVEKNGKQCAVIVGNPDDCIECEACVAGCEGEAITLN